MINSKDYRTRIYVAKIDRREIAKELKITYSTLCYKLNGFGKFKPEHEKKLEAILKKNHS
jgi:hypothetical protein